MPDSLYSRSVKDAFRLRDFLLRAEDSLIEKVPWTEGDSGLKYVSLSFSSLFLLPFFLRRKQNALPLRVSCVVTRRRQGHVFAGFSLKRARRRSIFFFRLSKNPKRRT